MTVLDYLKPLTLSAVRNDDRMLRNKFVVVCKCSGDRDTINCQCPVPGTYRETNAWGLPGGMLAVGIDSHIMLPVGLCEWNITTAHPVQTFVFKNFFRTFEAEILS